MMLLHWSRNNTKVQALGREIGRGAVAFGLPPVRTCPGAGPCRAYCYAQVGRQSMDPMKAFQLSNYAFSRRGGFAEILSNDLRQLEREGVEAIRMHDAGDFYGRRYLEAWIESARRLPQVVFYGYTKSLWVVEHAYETIGHPPNFRLTASYGGRWSDDVERISRRWWLPTAQIYATQEDLNRALEREEIEVDGSHTDYPAYAGVPVRIGIVAHGQRKGMFQ
jgi:hypothetical protein